MRGVVSGGFAKRIFRTFFYLPWSVDHDKVIQKIERAVTSGGLFAVAMPRGSGKNGSYARWPVYGRRLPARHRLSAWLLPAASVPRTFWKILKFGSKRIRFWPRIFPEVTFPVRALERIANRQKGQKP